MLDVMRSNLVPCACGVPVGALHRPHSSVSRARLDSFGSSSCGCDDAAVQVPRRALLDPRGDEDGVSLWRLRRGACAAREKHEPVKPEIEEDAVRITQSVSVRRSDDPRCTRSA
jgi:hypothetical protein